MITGTRQVVAIAAVVAFGVLAGCGAGSDAGSSPAATDPAPGSEVSVADGAVPIDTAAAPSRTDADADADTDTVADVTGAGDGDASVGDATADSSSVDSIAPAGEVPSGPRLIEHEYGTTEVPADPQRIVALSEEFLLADLLALSVTPVASSSNDPDSFSGVDPSLTEGIEIMTSATFNIERLATFRPDLIIAYPIYIELVGYEALSAVAPTVAIGDGASDWRERLESTAEVLGVEALGAARIAEFQTRHAAARDVLDGVQMSVASIFDPSFIRAYTDERTFLVQVLIDAGVDVVPDAESADGVDAAGRIQLSLEQLGVLDGDVLLLLQRVGVEDDGAAQVAESPLWATLPAVRTDAVITLDRLGYPGAEGAAAFATEVAAAVAART